MSDERRRRLETSVAAGDQSALPSLVRLLGREQDQESLCGLGLHDIDASRPEFATWHEERPAFGLRVEDSLPAATVEALRRAYGGFERDRPATTRISGQNTYAECRSCGERLPLQWVRNDFVNPPGWTAGPFTNHSKALLRGEHPMSVVTDIILAYSMLEEDDTAAGLGLVRVDQHAGGGKAMQANVFLGAFNHLDLSAFLKRVAALPWREPKNVTLLVQREHDEDGFEALTAWQELVEAHPAKCTCWMGPAGKLVKQGGSRRCPVHQPTD